MNIQTIETILVDIPIIRPHKLSVATIQTQTMVLIKMTDIHGTIGWGEATTIGGLHYGDESPESIKINIDSYFTPLITSLKDHNINQIKQKIN